MKKSRSFLKWAGSKYSCLDKILPHFPDSKRLIEPFTGSGSVFLNTNYDNNLLAEQNSDLIAVFKCIQQYGTDFIEYCRDFFSDENNKESRYYQLRTNFNQTQNPQDRAAIFLYLNRHGYNGLCRYNNQGIYNVPFGRYVKPYFPYNEMLKFKQKSLNTSFFHGDFRETFKLANPGDFIYCDPPYSPLNQNSNFSSYTSIKFGEEEQISLANAAKDAAGRGIKVIISNHDTEFTRKQYQGAELISFPVSRLINSNIKQRQPVKEIIAIF
ncbi:MAG: Dam family site-specific DNA-(adenine-N6)-methyltransferase [Legionellaceae bacterium]|nr:Dam family site-specific DNA-(adenine-N6)-methyltransferase [Legionellaceae bacterium]